MANLAPYKVDSGPATGAAAANHSDSAGLTNGSCRSLYVGTSGDVKVTMANGDVVTFTACPVGVLPFSVNQIFSAGTTASNIICLY